MALTKASSGVAARPPWGRFAEALTLRDAGAFARLIDAAAAEAAAARDADGRALLHWCAAANACAELQLCLERRLNTVDLADEDAWTPLHVAAAHNHHECVALLLRAGADPARTVAGSANSPLHIAASRGHLETLHLLLRDLPADLREAANAAGLTPLAAAVLAQQPLSVQALLEAQADARVRLPGSQETLLHAACGNQDLDTARVLLEHDAQLALLPDARGLRCADLQDPVLKHLCHSYLPS